MSTGTLEKKTLPKPSPANPFLQEHGRPGVPVQDPMIPKPPKPEAPRPAPGRPNRTSRPPGFRPVPKQSPTKRRLRYPKKGGQVTPPGKFRVPNSKGYPGMYPGSKPLPGTTPKPIPLSPSAPGIPKPGTYPKPKAGGLLFAELISLVAETAQEQLAMTQIDKWPLDPTTTETKKESQCWIQNIPP